MKNAMMIDTDINDQTHQIKPPPFSYQFTYLSLESITSLIKITRLTCSLAFNQP
jgi:hypothetical protein